MRFVICFFYMLVFAQLAIAQDSEPAGLPQKKLTVAVLVPLSGGPAEQGEWTLQGAELGKKATSELAVDVELRVEDTKADPKLAISAYKKLNADADIDAVISYGSGVAMALSPLCNREKVIQIGVATATPAYRSLDDYTFRNFPSAEFEAAFMVEKALGMQSAPKIAVVQIDNEYGRGTSKAFLEELGKKYQGPVREEILEPAGSDYRATITKIKAFQPTLIYLSVYPNEGALFLKQAKELGLTVPMLASVAILGAKNFFDLAGGGAEGLFIASSKLSETARKQGEVKKFHDLYRSKYGEPPAAQLIYVARAYDAVRALVAARTRCEESDGGCLKEKLFQMEPLHGPSGTVSFDRAGDVTSAFSLLRVKGERFEEMP